MWKKNVAIIAGAGIGILLAAVAFHRLPSAHPGSREAAAGLTIAIVTILSVAVVLMLPGSRARSDAGFFLEKALRAISQDRKERAIVMLKNCRGSADGEIPECEALLRDLVRGTPISPEQLDAARRAIPALGGSSLRRLRVTNRIVSVCLGLYLLIALVRIVLYVVESFVRR